MVGSRRGRGLVERLTPILQDEPQESDLIEKQLDENTWLFSARLEVDDLNKNYSFDLPYGDYNTIGGLVMFYAETIPKVNQQIEIPGFRITVTEAAENVLKTVKLKREMRASQPKE